MFWIDKHNKKSRNEGHEIVNHFIHDAWNEYCKSYVNCTYDSFKRNRKMEQLLLREQHGFCCYCMRHLESGSHTSLEHVMPHNSVDNTGNPNYRKINYYKRFNKIFKKNVTYIHLNGSTRKWHVGPPYPHFCAYENLVLSCDGSLFVDEDKNKGLYSSMIHYCCNEHRGNERITPFFFIQNVQDLIVYNKDGSISISKMVKSPSYQVELSNTIDNLGLEHDRLRIIRKVWCLIAESRMYTIEKIKEATDDKDLRTDILADSGVPYDLEKRVNHPIYWSLLCDYYWFFNYFTNH